jgi:excisionase family DNA binding protein
MIDEVMTISETARWLGINENVAYRLAQEGTLPGAMKIGGSWRVYKAALTEKFLKSGGAEISGGGTNGARPVPAQAQ